MGVYHKRGPPTFGQIFPKTAWKVKKMADGGRGACTIYHEFSKDVDLDNFKCYTIWICLKFPVFSRILCDLP